MSKGLLGLWLGAAGLGVDVPAGAAELHAGLIWAAPSASNFGPQEPGGRVQKRGITALDHVFVESRLRERQGVGLASELKRVGTFDSLFKVLSRGTIKSRVGERGAVTEALRPDERKALVGSFSRVPLPVLRKSLDAMIVGTVTPEEAIAAIEILACHGLVGDAQRLLDWAQRDGLKSRVPRAIRGAFEQNLRLYVVREPGAIEVLPALFDGANLSLLPSLLAALDPKRNAAHLKLVGELLGRVPQFDLYLLAEIASSTAQLRYVPDAQLSDQVRSYLVHSDARLVQEAITAANHLGDRRAIPSLIHHLHGKEPIRRGALAALSSITGQHMAPTRDAWNGWHDSVLTWWIGEAPKLIDMASKAKPGHAARAIQKLSMARMYRHELVAPLVRSLNRSEGDIVVLSSAALGHLGSMNAVAPLVEQLGKPSEDVRRAAYQALRRLTGENHGDDPDDWRRAGWGRQPEVSQTAVPR